MIKRSEATALAALVGVAGACAFGIAITEPVRGGPDLKPAVASNSVASEQEEGWFLLDTGFGYEGLPIFYRIDGGVLCAFTAYP